MTAVTRTDAPAPQPDERRSLVVDVADAGQRLDKYLSAQMPDVSRASIQKWIKDSRVAVEGEPARASLRLAAGQAIEIRIPPPVTFELSPEAIDLDIVYDDEYLAVINKPAGMVVHPAAGHWNGTLVQALMGQYPDIAESCVADDDAAPAGDLARPGIVHRLDKDTSGLIIVAKTAQICERLQGQFQAREVEKTYYALVEDVPDPSEGTIDAPIGRDRRQRKRMMVTRDGREAVTLFRVAEALGQFALLEVHPKTGRTHQIRVHMAFIGHPIVGDTVYGRRKQQMASPRQFLHAGEIRFTHPVTGERMTFSAPLPEDLRTLLDGLRKTEGV